MFQSRRLFLARGASLADVRERVLARGFTEVREVDWNDGVWEVEAITPTGQRVDLMLEPEDAEVMAEVSDSD